MRVIIQTPLVLAFTSSLSAFNIFDDSLYVSTSFKLLEVPFLQKFKNKQKNELIYE